MNTWKEKIGDFSVLKIKVIVVVPVLLTRFLTSTLPCI